MPAILLHGLAPRPTRYRAHEGDYVGMRQHESLASDKALATHLALIDEQRELRSTLVGEVPEALVERSVEALALGRPLPYDARAEGGGSAPDR